MTVRISHPTQEVFDTYASFKSKYKKINREITKGTQDKDLILDAIEKVVEKATLLEENQAKIIQHSKFLGLSPHVWKWIDRGISGMTFFTIAMASGSSILTSRYQNESNCGVPDVVIGFSTASAAVAFLGSTLSWIHGNLSEKKLDQIETLERKLAQVKSIKLFLLAYTEFVKSAKCDNNNAVDANYNQCVNQLKQNSLELSKVARDRWISAIIQILPDESQLKRLLIEQRELAERKLNILKHVEEKRILKMEEESSFNTNSSPLERRPSEEDFLYSFSEEYPVNDSASYLREKTATCMQNSSHLYAARNESSEIADLEHEILQIETKFTKNHKILQELIDLDIKECNLAGLWFKSSGEVARRPFKYSKSSLDIKVEE